MNLFTVSDKMSILLLICVPKIKHMKRASQKGVPSDAIHTSASSQLVTSSKFWQLGHSSISYLQASSLSNLCRISVENNLMCIKIHI